MAHRTIVILVRARDKKEAEADAKKVFDTIKAQSNSYDSFAIEDILKYDSEEGKTLLQMVFGHQTIEFNDHLGAVRQALKTSPAKTDAEMMENHEFRYHCWYLGTTQGWAVRVFDADAEGVQDNAHLRNVIEDWPILVERGQHVKSSLPLWVVSGNAHY